MSRVRADKLTDRAATGAPQLTYGVEVPVGYGITGAGGINVSGFATVGGVGEIAGSAVIGGITTISNTTESTSATTGALIISGGVGIAKSLNVTGNVTVGGTLTYEDVTNQDVIGLATFRSGVQFGAAGVGGTITAVGNANLAGIVTCDRVTAQGGVEFGAAGVGGTITQVGNAEFAGIATATQFVGILTGGTSSGATVGVGTTGTIFNVVDGATQNRFRGVLVEKVAIQDTSITTAGAHVDPANGNVHYFTTNGSGASVIDVVYKGGNNLSSFMKVGENISFSVISKPNNSEYVNAVTIDGSNVTEYWSGGTPSSASGAASTFTITTVNITRIAATGTPDNDYLVLCQATNYET